jgi:hypothetical protein
MLVWDDGHGLVAARVRLRDRLVARVAASSLDAKLAAGRPPEEGPALALRAQILVRPSYRRGLADSIHGLVSRARRPAQALTTAPPLCRERILYASADLAELSRRLDGGGPVAAEGVARAAALLRDGRGPLYSRRNCVQLRPLLQSIIRDLDAAVAV